MKRNWLFLRPFDESHDAPFEQLPMPAVALSLILTAAQPISIIISVIIAAYQAMLRRRGHAANQLILSAILLGLLCLAGQFRA